VEPGSEDDNNSSSSVARSSSSVRSSSSTNQNGSSSSVAGSSSSIDQEGSSSSIETLINLGSVSELKVSKSITDSWLLSWVYTPGTDVETGFQIDTYNETENAWEAYDSVGVGTYRYVFNTEVPGAFRVSAFNEDGRSTFSNEVVINSSASVNNPAVQVNLGSVTDLSISNNVSGSWILTWKHVQGSDVENGFQIDTYNDTKNEWEAFDSVLANTYRYVFGSNTPGVYRVSAFNEKGRSAYSNELETQITSPELIDLQKPTKLVAIRLAPSVWQLSWDYTATINRREKGFIVEKYDATLLNWVVWDTVDSDVKRIVLDSVLAAVDLSLGSYRVTAYDSLGRSDYSNDIQVNIQTEYSPDIIFVPPTNMVPNASNPAYLELLIPTNPVNKSVEFSPYTASLSYEALWVIEDTEESPVSFSFSKNSVTHSVDPATNALCDSYARIRLVWTDINGVVDYSEWSVPTGSKPGTRGSGLIDLKPPTNNCPELTKVGP